LHKLKGIEFRMDVMWSSLEKVATDEFVRESW
jgi:hypothetical protein